jgi:dCTP deaminase
MIFSDRDIKLLLDTGLLKITPPPLLSEQLQPASLDLRLADKIRRFVRPVRMPGKIGKAVDVRDAEAVSAMTFGCIIPQEGFVIEVDELIIGYTMERIELPANVTGVLNGRSSLGRLGLTIHKTAGFIDPGFKGNIVLEIRNNSPQPLKLYPCIRIAQLVFFGMTSYSEHPYGSPTRTSKYQDQSGPVASKIYDDSRGNVKDSSK